jgi:hypothetical protein
MEGCGEDIPPLDPVFVDRGDDFLHPAAFSQIRPGNIEKAGHYDILRISHSTDPREVRKIAGPGAVILIAINPKKISAWDTPANRELHASLREEWFYHTPDGERLQAGLWKSWELRPVTDAMEVLAVWAAGQYGHFDDGGPGGIFVDQAGPGLPLHTLEQIPGYENLDLETLQLEYRMATMYLLKRLRELLPDPFVIITNSWSLGKAEYLARAGIERIELPNPVLELLNGITIEYPVVQDLKRYEAVARMARFSNRQVVSVAWGHPGWFMFDENGPMLYGGIFNE